MDKSKYQKTHPSASNQKKKIANIFHSLEISEKNTFILKKKENVHYKSIDISRYIVYIRHGKMLRKNKTQIGTFQIGS